MQFFLALLLVAPLTGCAGLLVHSEDSRLTKAGKVAARIPLAISTLGISEALHFCAGGTEPRLLGTTEDAKANWEYLTPQERIGECNKTLKPSGDALPGYAFQDRFFQDALNSTRALQQLASSWVGRKLSEP